MLNLVVLQIRVVQFEVRPKVWVRELAHILTKLLVAVRSLVKVRLTFKSASNFIAACCMRLSKLQGTAAPTSSVPIFPCSKSNMFNDLFHI
jgi:hypothetical protein